MEQQSERRLVENEIIFRQANTDMKDFIEDVGAQHNTTLPFFCECSRMNCRRRIELSSDQYQKLHSNRRRFIVVDGHEVPQIERVVERHPGFNVVEKIAELPGEQDVDIAIKHLTL